MNNRRIDPMALLGCIGIIVVAFVLLRSEEKTRSLPFSLFGYVLDALVTTGVIGNLIVFLLLKTTKLNPFALALATFAVVHAVLLALDFACCQQSDPGFNLPGVSLVIVVSFLFWTGFHWAWTSNGAENQPQQEQQISGPALLSGLRFLLVS